MSLYVNATLEGTILAVRTVFPAIIGSNLIDIALGHCPHLSLCPQNLLLDIEVR